MTRERPINLRDHEVRAILDGRKTMIRRPVRLGAEAMAYVRSIRPPITMDERALGWCPFGAPGDLLWVRECHGVTTGHRESDLGAAVRYRADGEILAFTMPAESALPLRMTWKKWRPSIHMPRWASRLTLRVADRRVERLWEITESEAVREGFTAEKHLSALHAFADAWTYGDEHGWQANPLVWVGGVEVVR